MLAPRRLIPGLLALGLTPLPAAEPPSPAGFTITEDSEMIRVTTPTLQAAVRKKGYVTGVAAGSLVDGKTGFHDSGFGLDIVDWIMEPGSDAAYREKLPGDLPYSFGNLVHGNIPKRSVEGPQICTQARELSPRIIRGKDFVAVTQEWKYTLAAPGRKAGSTWTQTLVFPSGQRYFVSSDRMLSVNAGDELFFRLDMPGHIRHTRGDTFSGVFLSYVGEILRPMGRAFVPGRQ